MKTLTKYLLLATSTFFIGSCSGFLDVNETILKNEQETFNNYGSIKNLLTTAYTFVDGDFGVIGNATRDAATDDAIYTWENSSIYDVYNGLWSDINVIDDQWSHYYQGIYHANYFMSTVKSSMLDDYKWNATYQQEVTQLEIHHLEARLLRAYFHFELAVRYHDVPLVKRVLDKEEVNSIKKTSFDDIMAFVVEECDELLAAENPALPTNHSSAATGGWGETGRVTKGFAMALKSRALLYAASPLNNPTGDKEKWEAAAKAAWDLIQSGLYSLEEGATDPLFKQHNDPLTSKQLILESRYNNANSFEKRNLPFGYHAVVAGGITPTQNLADVYGFADGSDFDFERDKDRMYEGRDPRFYRNIMHDGSVYKGTTIETFTGGANGKPLLGATLTGYYQRRYIYEGVDINTGSEKTLAHHYILFRYAETLLNYAEAMYELTGSSSATFGEMSMSAYDAIVEVRTKAGVASTPANIDLQFIRDERRRELALENHRYWDIRRWKIGEVVKDIYGVEITSMENVKSYKKVKVQSRVWEDKMYWYPIKRSETLLNPNLKQNSGWD